ncbi:MAG TPA: hypothetical protein VND19_14720, partial [Acetobacteraceae bacterium]|nr:hypothetical protein [Acetobacteraceae bacterium]
MTEVTAVLFDRRIVVGAVHQIVEVGDPRRGHGGERNGELAVMHGRRGERATDRYLAIRDVDAQLIADPGLLVSFGIALDPDIAVPWQFAEHRGQCHAQLAFDPARRLGGP